MLTRSYIAHRAHRDARQYLDVVPRADKKYRVAIVALARGAGKTARLHVVGASMCNGRQRIRIAATEIAARRIDVSTNAQLASLERKTLLPRCSQLLAQALGQ